LNVKQGGEIRFRRWSDVNHNRWQVLRVLTSRT
jgi:hypothetical protein